MRIFKKEKAANTAMEQEIRLRLERQEQEFQKCIHEKLQTIAFLVAENHALRMKLEKVRQKTDRDSEQRAYEYGRMMKKAVQNRIEEQTVPLREKICDMEHEIKEIKKILDSKRRGKA